MFKKTITAFIAAAIFTPLTFADVSGHVGLSSDYFWRGVSQNAGNTAVSASLNFEKSGFYASAWGSQVDFGDAAKWEYDLYGGYDLKVSDDMTVGGGVIQYNYDKGDYEAVEELFAKAVYKDTNITYYVDTDNRDNAYLDVRQGLPFIKPVNVSLEYGSFKDGDSHTAIHVGKQVGKIYVNLMVMDGARHGKATDMIALSTIYNF